MAEARFDIVFSAEVVAASDPDVVRRRLQRRFGLSDADAARLFSGQRVTVKRGVDAATAAGFREAFRAAGALVQLRPVPTGHQDLPSSLGQQRGAASTDKPHRSPRSDGGRLALYPMEPGEPLERAPVVCHPGIDTGHLSLVEGGDWTLEDCQPPAIAPRRPDTSHLQILEPGTQGRETRQG